MKTFLNDDFMLKNETAIRLFHKYAENLPIIDYHCHLSPQEIYENKRFNNISEIWLGGRQPDGSYSGDHYKWRLMRSNGISEEFITGDADAYDKFYKFAETLEMSIGNPMYHWSNLELKKYFNISTPLTTENARVIWDKTSEMLSNDPDLTIRGIIKKSNVRYIGTTDDPADSLEWHDKIVADKDIDFLVRPSFRPDKAINIQKDGFIEYISLLAKSVGKDVLTSAKEVCDALEERLLFFISKGCKASDHGLDYIPYEPCTEAEADEIFRKAMNKEELTKSEVDKYQTYILLKLGRLYSKKNIVMEVHYSVTRNVNERAFKTLGADTGYDIIAKSSCGIELSKLLSELDKKHELPKTIIFSLDHSDFNLIGSCIGAFQSDEIASKIQMGAAWWFLDSRDGMEEQMRALANLGILGNFIGMLTDSRSFLSYTRHDYFRRIMCNLIGKWVEDGEYPDNEKSLKKIVEGISYYNAEKYFSI